MSPCEYHNLERLLLMAENELKPTAPKSVWSRFTDARITMPYYLKETTSG